jgi:tetratricopeptide (TPR) repeat protein
MRMPPEEIGRRRPGRAVVDPRRKAVATAPRLRRRARGPWLAVAASLTALAAVAAIVGVVLLTQEAEEPTANSPTNGNSSPAIPTDPAEERRAALREMLQARPDTVAEYDELIARLRALRSEVSSDPRLTLRQQRSLQDEISEAARRLEIERSDLEEYLKKEFENANEEINHLIRLQKFDEARQLAQEQIGRETDPIRRRTLEDHLETIRTIEGPIARLREIRSRILAGQAGQDDVAVIRELMEHGSYEVEVYAQETLVLLSLPALKAYQRQRLAERAEEARRRVAAIEAGDESQRLHGEPDAGILFVGPARPTCLDDTLDLLEDELAEYRDRFARIVSELQSARRWYELQERGRANCRAGLAELARVFEGIAVVHYWQAAAALAGEDFRLAIEAARKAIEAAPDFAEPYAILGRAYLELNQFDLARQNLERALEKAPDLSYAHLYLALLAMYEDDKEGCRRGLERAGRLDAAMEAPCAMVDRVLDGPEWERRFEHRTQHYLVITDDSPARAEQIGRRLEAMREVYARLLGGPIEAGREGHVVRVHYFRTPQGFYRYQLQSTGEANPAVLGYYTPTFRQFNFYDLTAVGGSGFTEEDFWHVVYHEGFHHYAHMAMPHIPRWLNEALAEYAGGTRIGSDDRTVEETGLVDSFLRKSRIQQGLRQMVRGHEYATFREIMREPTTSPDVGYVQGWSMIHFLLHADGGAHRQTFETYIGHLRRGGRSEDAFGAAFPGRLDLTGSWFRYARDELVERYAPEEPPQSPQAPAPPGP